MILSGTTLLQLLILFYYNLDWKLFLRTNKIKLT
jgi:hypothetical protein